MRTSSARRRKTLYPASTSAFSRSSRVVNLTDSTDLMRKGSMIVLNSMAAGDSTRRPAPPAPREGVFRRPPPRPKATRADRPQLALCEVEEGEGRVERVPAQRGVQLAAEPRIRPLESPERVEVVEGHGRLGRDVPREQAQEVPRGVPRHEEARREELAPRRAPPAHEEVPEELAREPAVVRNLHGLRGDLRHPRRHAAAVEEHRVAVRAGDEKLVEVEDREFEEMPVLEDDLQPVLRLAVDEDRPVRAGEPGEVRPEGLLRAGHRDDEEVVVREGVGRDPVPRHRAEGDEADDPRVARRGRPRGSG